MIVGAGRSQFTGRAGRLEIQVRAAAAVLNPKAENSQNFYVAIWRQNSFFEKLQSLFLRFPTDWMRPIHVVKGHLLYLKSIDYKC